MKKTKIILTVLFFAVICFIWGNSVLSAELSDKISRAVGELLSGLFKVGDETTTVGGLSIRKIGHFCEFFVLGAIVWFLSKLWISDRVLGTVVTAFVGFVVPLIDETIQIFSGRGHSIRDVWIDISGFFSGIAVAFGVAWLVGFISKRVKNKHK